MIGIKCSDNEIPIRILNHQRLPNFNSNEHRFIKLQKQFKQQLDRQQSGKTIQNRKTQRKKRHLRVELEEKISGKERGVDRIGSVGEDPLGVVLVSVGEEMVPLHFGARRPCIHRKWHPSRHLYRHLQLSLSLSLCCGCACGARKV